MEFSTAVGIPEVLWDTSEVNKQIVKLETNISNNAVRLGVKASPKYNDVRRNHSVINCTNINAQWFLFRRKTKMSKCDCNSH